MVQHPCIAHQRFPLDQKYHDLSLEFWPEPCILNDFNKMRRNASVKKVFIVNSVVIQDTRMYSPSFEPSHHADSEKYHHEGCSITNVSFEVKTYFLQLAFLTSNGVFVMEHPS